jgi:hypothetical protein
MLSADPPVPLYYSVYYIDTVPPDAYPCYHLRHH